MYYDNLENLVGTQCICCGAFIPMQGIDEYGHEVHFPENKMGLCPECFEILIDVIKERKNKNKENTPHY